MNDLTISGNSALDSLLDQKLTGLGSSATASPQNKNLTEADKAGIQKAARGFESIFFGLMFKQMKETKIDQKSDDDGFGADILDGYTNMALSDQISNTGTGIGVAQLIYKQMTGEDLPSKNVINPANATDIFKNLNSASAKSGSIKPISSANLTQVTTQAIGMSSNLKDKINRWDSIISSASEKYGLDPGLIKAVVAAESAGNPNAVSSAGAKGLMQLMDSTATDVGVKNAFNPSDNIDGGANYLKQMLDKFDGNIDHALAAYNAGPGNVDKYGGVPPFDETRSYVNKVKKYINYYK